MFFIFNKLFRLYYKVIKMYKKYIGYTYSFVYLSWEV